MLEQCQEAYAEDMLYDRSTLYLARYIVKEMFWDTLEVYLECIPHRAGMAEKLI